MAQPQFGLGRELWLSLPREIRLQLNTIFKIPQSEYVQVMDSQGGKVVHDGHTEKDLSVVTEEAMRKYLGVPESVGENWESLFKAVLLTFERKEEKKEPAFTVVPNQKALTEEELKAWRIEKGLNTAADGVAPKKRAGRPKKVIVN